MMVEDAITAYGQAGLHLLQQGKTVNPTNYLEILIKIVSNWFRIRNFDIFKYNRATCHETKFF